MEYYTTVAITIFKIKCRPGGYMWGDVCRFAGCRGQVRSRLDGQRLQQVHDVEDPQRKPL